MSKMFIINDVSGQNDEISGYAGQFLPYAHKRLGFNKPVNVNFISDPENAKNPLGNTGYYDPKKMAITIFVDKRHVKDILRSLSHELVHHTQNCRGEFDQGAETAAGYAQKDPHMRKMEAEAYLLGSGFLFRDWEDQLKQKKEIITMSEGYKGDKMEEEELEESNTPGITTATGKKELPISKDGECPAGYVKNEEGTKCVPAVAESKELEEEELEETNENWFKGNKDQLLFEALMKKWAK